METNRDYFFTYCVNPTGGGAFLELVEGKKLPALAMLEARAAK